MMAASSESADEAPTTAAFNGGKMEHIFKFGDGEAQNDYQYIDEFHSDEAKRALEEGSLYFKIDGANGMIKMEDDEQDGRLIGLQRLDTKGKPMPNGCLELPPGQNPDTYSMHSYFYDPITLNVQGKKAIKRNKAMLQIIENHAEHIRSKMRESGTDFVSIEWVGAKFNKTPNVPEDVAIAIHSEQVCSDAMERTYGGMREYLLEAEQPSEGLIIFHVGKYWKLRSECFDRKCSFITNKAAARPPVFLAPIDQS